MRSLFGSMMLLVALCLLLTGVQAGEKGKKVVLKGTITCAKCDLAKETKCMTVIVTKEKGKDVIYYFDTKSSGKYHKKICREPAPNSTVEGTCVLEDGKKIVTPTKVTYGEK